MVMNSRMHLYVLDVDSGHFYHKVGSLKRAVFRAVRDNVLAALRPTQGRSSNSLTLVVLMLIKATYEASPLPGIIGAGAKVISTPSLIEGSQASQSAPAEATSTARRTR
jgi:hypothetical protein